VSPMYGYTSARAIQTVESYISTLSAAFPYAVMSMACGRNGNLDPTSGGVLPTNPDGDYDCEQIIQASMPLYGDRFCIQKNSLATFSGNESSPADFFLILSEFNGQLQENMQALWFVYGDTSYRDNGGVPAGYGSILSTMLQDTLTWQSPDPVGFRESVIELYQTDVENLPGTIKKYSQ